jgi:hypothetical protein
MDIHESALDEKEEEEKRSYRHKSWGDYRNYFLIRGHDEGKRTRRRREKKIIEVTAMNPNFLFFLISGERFA